MIYYEYFRNLNDYSDLQCAESLHLLSAYRIQPLVIVIAGLPSANTSFLINSLWSSFFFFTLTELKHDGIRLPGVDKHAHTYF